MTCNYPANGIYSRWLVNPLFRSGSTQPSQGRLTLAHLLCHGAAIIITSSDAIRQVPDQTGNILIKSGPYNHSGFFAK